LCSISYIVRLTWKAQFFYCLKEYCLHIVDYKTAEAEYLDYFYLESLTSILIDLNLAILDSGNLPSSHRTA